MISTQSLYFSYPHQELHFPNIFCKEKESLLILGESGKGKTTFLHLLAGLLKAKSGEIWINQTNITTLKNKELDFFRGKNIGIVFQKNYFVESLSVLENILIAPFLIGQKADKQKALSLLNSLGLFEKRHQKTHQLSQGEQQRLSLARAFINEAKLILADEPTSALDDRNCEQVMVLLEEKAQEHKASLLIVTHDQRLKDRFKNTVLL